jgi:hypothetical protein
VNGSDETFMPFESTTETLTVNVPVAVGVQVTESALELAQPPGSPAHAYVGEPLPVVAVLVRVLLCWTASSVVFVAVGVPMVGSAETVKVTAVLPRLMPLLSVTPTVVAKVPAPTEVGVQVNVAVFEDAQPEGSVPQA